MVVGERFVKDGKTYEVSEVWGNNYGFHEVKEEVKEPIIEDVREIPTFEEEVEEAIEATKKRGRRKKV